jgi:demethylmenaquinone methyltransferase/2-methoxy-6-polyprenyl-1,4-benzoquinol methylase
MKGPSIRERVNEITSMFDAISQRYDTANTIISLGMDKLWRRTLIQMAGIGPSKRVLDLGTGTGELLREAERTGAMVVGLDRSQGMVSLAKRKYPWARLLVGDAVCLPFRDQEFDCVISAFVLRNVPLLIPCLGEQIRVLKRGGRLMAMDTMPVSRANPLSPLITFYLYKVIPFVGRFISGDLEAYRYLADSTMHFKAPQEMLEILRGLSLKDVGSRTFAFGTVVIYYGKKP